MNLYTWNQLGESLPDLFTRARAAGGPGCRQRHAGLPS